ncbi:putative RNA methyltransferase [Virgibacillus soli]
MTSKERSAQMVNRMEDVFQCPLCKSPIKVVDLKSLICTNNHTYDFAKQGYVNMMARPVKSHYDKQLFAARHKIIAESKLYTEVHKKISEVMRKHVNGKEESIRIFDAGCGEGSHLQQIVNECKDDKITGIGLDISKEGIALAARNHKESMIWLVGDLASSPFTDQSLQTVLNFLSPANYKEFKRILAPGGLMIKVVPRTHYLKELRDEIFGKTDKESYENDKTVSLFQTHFDLVNQIKLNYTKKLSKAELINLVHMSPLAWNSDEAKIATFLNQDFRDITIDLDILVGINNGESENR